MARPDQHARFDNAKQHHAADAAAKELGIELVSVGAGTCHMRMTVMPWMTNAHGGCHGGLIFSLADSAFATLCNSDGPVTVASSASIEFLSGAAVGEALHAEAVELKRGRAIGTYEITVRAASSAAEHEDDCRIVARFIGRSYQTG